VKALAAILVVMTLAGCAAARALVYVPKHVPVYVERPVKLNPGEIDPQWLKPCPTDEAKEETYKEAKRLSESRLQIILTCDHADKAKLRSAIEKTK